MASPVPYSQPKHRVIRHDELSFVTAKGAYVYAPAAGTMEVVDDTVVIFDGHLRHVLKNVRLGRKRAPFPGARIGHATGRRVYYSVEYKDGRLWRTGDPMPTILRGDSQRRPRHLMPHAHKIVPTSPPGVMGPGNERSAVWHTSESDPGSIEIVADWVQQQGSSTTSSGMGTRRIHARGSSKSSLLMWERERWRMPTTTSTVRTGTESFVFRFV